MNNKYNNTPIKVLDFKKTTPRYKSLQDTLGKTMIACGTLELIAQASFYINETPNTGIVGTTGVLLIAYGIKTYKNGSKLVDIVYSQE
jgi:hypothetical protein